MTKKLIDPDKAFEKYYTIGGGRSIARLHEILRKATPKTTPSYDSLKRWSIKYNWQDRILLRDNAVREGVQASVSAVVVEAKIKELEQLDTAYSEIEAVKPLIVSALQSKHVAKIMPETTQEVAALYNALSRLDSVQVKIVETARKIRGESDKVDLNTTINVKYEDPPSDDRD